MPRALPGPILVKDEGDEGSRTRKTQPFPTCNILVSKKNPKPFLMLFGNISKCCSCCRGGNWIITGREGVGHSGVVKSKGQHCNAAGCGRLARSFVLAGFLKAPALEVTWVQEILAFTWKKTNKVPR